MRDLHKLAAIEAAELIRTGAISSEALVADCLDRITEREPIVAAWEHRDPSRALAQARAADTKRSTGAQLGPLHGVPVGIKDIIDTADYPTENGTPIFHGRRPGADAEVVHRLKAAGAVVLGKTVTTELAFFGPGKTRNPRNPEHTPGGSSSGSAAAVADFHVPLALGTQTAGSIIRPASYCGTVGMKPTFGTVPRDGVLEQSPPLDTIGGYARNVHDMKLLMDVLRGMNASPLNFRDRVRFAFIKSSAWPMGDPQMRDAFAALAAKHAAVIEERDLPELFADTSGLQRAVQFRDIARNYGPLCEAHPGAVSAKLLEVVAEGRTVSDAEYAAALNRREALYESLSPILAAYDAILTPSAPGVAPRGLSSTGSPMFNFLWSYLGVPAVNVPLLNVDGLPLGVQLVGRRNEDAALLAVAAALQVHAA